MSRDWSQDPRNRRLDKMWELKRAKPSSELEALMMSAPGEDRTVELEPHALADVITELLSQFSEDDRDMIVMSLVEKLSIRDIAEVMSLSKSDVHRRLGPLMRRVQEVFKSNPTIKEYLSGR